mmetsp:Transcript_7137/g.9327  ORF Transcript_7137/g.9327 Transcript_7137/m.9327 type:complete len:85 (-) Transcript_7137:748-1002(-)
MCIEDIVVTYSNIVSLADAAVQCVGQQEEKIRDFQKQGETGAAGIFENMNNRVYKRTVSELKSKCDMLQFEVSFVFELTTNILI